MKSGPYTVEIVGEAVQLCDTAEQAIMAVKRKMHVSDAVNAECRLMRGEIAEISYGFHHATITPHGARLVTALRQVCYLDVSASDKVRLSLASILLASRETTSTLGERYAELIKKVQALADNMAEENGKVEAAVGTARDLLAQFGVAP